MFNSVFSRIGNAGTWRRAAIELCEVPDGADASGLAQRLLTVAGGIALVISRCPKGQAKRHYPATVELYGLIRSGFRRRGIAQPDAEVLLESFHEVSSKLDPASRVAFRECLQAQREKERRAAPSRPRSAPPAPVRDDTRVPLSPSSFEVLEDN